MLGLRLSNDKYIISIKVTITVEDNQYTFEKQTDHISNCGSTGIGFVNSHQVVYSLEALAPSLIKWTIDI